MIKSSTSATTVTPIGSTSTPPAKSRKKAYKWLAIIGVVVLFWVWPKPKPQANQHPGLIINEDRRVCVDAWKQEQDHVNDHRAEDIPYFDVVLTQDACFEGDVWRPDSWHGHKWEKEFISDESDAHVSFWFHGWNPMGPYYRNNLPEFDSPPSKQFRLKGKGTLRYFRTD